MSGNHHFAHVDIGIRALDASYQCLEFVLDRLFHPQVMCAVRGGACARIKDTIRFLTRNLEREEQLMRESEYPFFAAHKREHEKLLRTLAKMERTMICGKYDNRQVSEFLADWMDRHVVTFDKPFSDYVRERGADGIGPRNQIPSF